MKTIRKDNTSEEVRILTGHLRRQGFPSLAETTVFTAEVHNAVIEFQRNKGLTADGIVGYRTWEALLVSGRKHSERLTEDDFILLGRLLDCDPVAVKAVQKIETGGRGGFFSQGKPAILFEGHIFWRQLKEKGISPESVLEENKGVYDDILYPSWTKKHYKGGMSEYERLERARRINSEAADKSASWGMFQIMGFNHKLCGEPSVTSFVETMSRDEFGQMILFARFIAGNKKMHETLCKEDWSEFARMYNGPGYKENQYDTKLKGEADRLRGISA